MNYKIIYFALVAPVAGNQYRIRQVLPGLLGALKLCGRLLARGNHILNKLSKDQNMQHLPRIICVRFNF